MSALKEQFRSDRSRIAWIDSDASVESISAPLGDLHDGSAVCILTLTDASTLVAKPKGSAIEALVLRFLGDSAIRVANFGTRSYWSEANGKLPKTPEAWAIFLEQYGYLCGLAWQLTAFDLHWNNLLLHDGAPVLIDLELFAEATDHRSRTITTTGLVPYVHKVVAGVAVDQSPLAALVARASSEMQALAEQDLEQGFRRAIADAARIAELRASFRDLPVRRIFRPTRSYARLAKGLADGSLDTCQIQACLERNSPALPAPVLEAMIGFECSQLLLGCIPKFEGKFEGEELSFGGKTFTVAKETGGAVCTNAAREEERLVDAFRALKRRISS